MINSQLLSWSLNSPSLTGSEDTVFTWSHHWSQSKASCIQSTRTHTFFNITFNIIIPSMCRFPLRFRTRVLSHCSPPNRNHLQFCFTTQCTHWPFLEVQCLSGPELIDLVWGLRDRESMFMALLASCRAKWRFIDSKMGLRGSSLHWCAASDVRFHFCSRTLHLNVRP
jgi:hypothetical protein